MTGRTPGKAILHAAVVFATAFAAHTSAGQPVGVSPHEANAARVPVLGGEGFRIRGTDHFSIASDGEDSVAASVGERLEATYRAVVRFCDELRLPVHPPSQPLPVLLFNRDADFERYARTVGFADASAPGFYHAGSNIAAFCNVLDLPKVREISRRIDQAQSQRDPPTPPERITEWQSQRDALVEVFNRLVVQHEAAHQILFNIGVLVREADNPEWLMEGLACQFEVLPRETDGERHVVNQMRLADFRDAVGVPPSAVVVDEQSLRNSLSEGRLLPLANLVGGAEIVMPDAAKTVFRYAQAWALVDYLCRTRPDSFATYLRLIAARPPNEPADKQHRTDEFALAFRPLNESFEHAWLAYILKLPFDPVPGGNGVLRRSPRRIDH
jgi:hypothetical protein